ncbi:hypothetical protein CHARACLAT_022740 [Characodon lateralis]|uniref:protein disulfide-isomerase n=1 Tax=Characodon lateralis TaxID=208331 RepID=A0ABU7DTK6_9TELE|nr:hypothetical protein [Characodon lateralis]
MSFPTSFPIFSSFCSSAAFFHRHQSVFRSSPLLGCFLFGLPLGVISLMCYGICTAESDDGSDEKREGLTDEEEEEEEEEEEQRQAAELEGPEDEEDVGEKNPEEKKTD